MIERRKAHRQRVMLGGWADFPHWHVGQECVVRDLSADGARLRFDRRSLVPNVFDLRLRHRGEARTIRLVWRHGAEVGIAFQAAPEVLPSPSGDAVGPGAGGDDPAREARDRAVLAQRIATFVTHRRRPEQAP